MAMHHAHRNEPANHRAIFWFGFCSGNVRAFPEQKAKLKRMMLVVRRNRSCTSIDPDITLIPLIPFFGR